jgi:tetratricopeptide (TPR) repeat protein/mono/diheme cytochrome c family protein
MRPFSFVVAALTLGSMGLAGSSVLGADATGNATVTFNKDIAPLVFQHCAACHREGESGPFPLLTYEDVRSHAKQIAVVTASRIMPPWLPEHGYGEFAGERRLTDEQIGLIEKWVKAGVPQGNPRDLPEPPRFTKGWQIGEPDLVVTMPEPFTLPADGLDVYRNFVVPIPLSETKWVRALELRPGNSRPVHHAFMLVDPSSASRRYDAEDAEPGFPGMDPRKAFGPAGQFISWQPGKLPHAGSDEVAWRLNPGTDLVLQLHMQTTGKPELIQASVGLFFADGPGDKHPQKLVLQVKGIDIPAGEANYTIQEDYRLPVDVQVLGILPHAHYLGKRLEAYARLPDGSTRWLLLIKQWDFNWQGDYQYKEPVLLPAGSLLSMRFTYDNSAENVRNPNHPPRRVTYGLNSTDEMGELWLQVLPQHPQDLDYLQRDYGRFVLNKSLERCRRQLEANPADVLSRVELGHILMGFGRMGEAEAHLSRAVELGPDSADAHYFYGHVLLRQRRFDEAEKEISQAIALEPERLDALHDMGLLHLQKNNPIRAEEFLRRAALVHPYDAVTQANLALSLLGQQKYAEAIPHLERAIDLDPTDTKSRERLEVARQSVELQDFSSLEAAVVVGEEEE